MTKALPDALRRASSVRGWDWMSMRTRMGDLGWSYIDVLRCFAKESKRALDIGTGGGEVFSDVARPQDVALDIKPHLAAIAREKLPCPVVVGDHVALPLRDECFDLVADRHVGGDPREVLRMLAPAGVYVTQHPGGRICQSIFDAFGWGTNGDFWRREAAEHGRTLWNVAALASFYEDAGCEIVRREEADVDYEFLDEDSLAFWLRNAPLPETVDPDRHAKILESLSLKTNWHSELLVVRRR